MAGFTHLDGNGNARMVDVAGKPVTSRRAVARCRVLLSAEAVRLLAEQALPKGDALAVARIAGIQAAKRTSEIIPLCHQVPLSSVDLDFTVNREENWVEITAEARALATTGVEMEALVACQAAALALYDMCKAVQKDIRITDCRLIHKSGGRSGLYQAE